MIRFEDYARWCGGEIQRHGGPEEAYSQIFRTARPALLEWIRNHLHPRAIWEGVNPEEVFHGDELKEWALKNGFVWKEDAS